MTGLDMTGLELWERLGPALAVGLYAAPLAVAVATDLMWFRIPNVLVVLLAVGFVPAALLAPHPVAWGLHLGLAGAALLVGVALFAMGWLGAGDVKLCVAVMLWCGPEAPTFLVVTGLAGGAIALVLHVGRRFISGLIPLVTGTAPALPEVLLPGAPVPYGIAIAAGGLFTAGRLPVLW